MANPYESPTAPADGLPGNARWTCGIATVIAILGWFMVLGTLLGHRANPAGMFVYAVVLLLIAVPAVIVNVYLLSPAIYRQVQSASAGGQLVVHMAIGVAAAVLLAAWIAVAAKFPGLTWTIIPWTLAIYLTPPLLAGSFIYARSMSTIKRHD